MESNYEKVLPSKTNPKKKLKHIRNRKAFLADCTRKRGNISSIILARLLLLITIYSGKLLNHTFQAREIIDRKLNLSKIRAV